MQASIFTPLSPQQWNYETAAHLLNRAGFVGAPAEIEAAYGKGLEATVHDLVDVSDDLANVPPPGQRKSLPGNGKKESASSMIWRAKIFSIFDVGGSNEC